MGKVQILLSTYNGEKYLEEQLKSILNQDYSEVSILIRDDGSQDRTMDIIEKYTQLNNRISCYSGENIGACKSFFDLIINTDTSFDYYAFSDQDDVWKSDKMKRAVQLLGADDGVPALYCCKTELVDENLKPMEYKIHWPVMRPAFGNALIENICVGCTCVINKSLLELVKKHIPEFAVMHDWWLYLIASAFGKVIYDEKAYIQYRQHGKNEMGIRLNYLEEFKRRAFNRKKDKGQRRHQALEFLRLYTPDEEKLATIKLLIHNNFLSRLKLLFSRKIYRQRKIDDLIMKTLILLDLI